MCQNLIKAAGYAGFVKPDIKNPFRAVAVIGDDVIEILLRYESKSSGLAKRFPIERDALLNDIRALASFYDKSPPISIFFIATLLSNHLSARQRLSAECSVTAQPFFVNFNIYDVKIPP